MWTRTVRKTLNNCISVVALQICDHGYTFFAFTHSNRAKWRECWSYKGILLNSSAFFILLWDELPRKYQRRISRTMYTLDMKNYFSSIKTFKLLRKREIGAVLTVRSNSGGFPKEQALSQKSANLKWYTTISRGCADSLVSAVTWTYNGALQMLFTVHRLGEHYKIEQMGRPPRIV